MPAVLLHGNPETPAIWGPLLNVLQRTDVITPQLPGFGIPSPAGWGATKEEYVDWLIGVLEEIGEPVDLVGHDWGGGFVARVACLRPDLIRSWVCDVTALIHPDYVWHDFAQIWLTPGAGEQFFIDNLATPVADRVNLYIALGMTQAVAEDVVAAGNAEMGRCVLALYRSATHDALIEWGNAAESATTRPGMALINTEDHFVGPQRLGEEMGRRMGAHVEIMQGMGHWWMMQDPTHGAEVLERFWATV